MDWTGLDDGFMNIVKKMEKHLFGILFVLEVFKSLKKRVCQGPVHHYTKLVGHQGLKCPLIDFAVIQIKLMQEFVKEIHCFLCREPILFLEQSIFFKHFLNQFKSIDDGSMPKYQLSKPATCKSQNGFEIIVYKMLIFLPYPSTHCKGVLHYSKSSTHTMIISNCVLIITPDPHSGPLQTVVFLLSGNSFN